MGMPEVVLEQEILQTLGIDLLSSSGLGFWELIYMRAIGSVVCRCRVILEYRHRILIDSS